MDLLQYDWTGMPNRRIPSSHGSFRAFTGLWDDGLETGELPEEVRAALEERQEEAVSREDARRILREMGLGS